LLKPPAPSIPGRAYDGLPLRCTKTKKQYGSPLPVLVHRTYNGVVGTLPTLRGILGLAFCWAQEGNSKVATNVAKMKNRYMKSKPLQWKNTRHSMVD
jgi:hypothetical protein